MSAFSKKFSTPDDPSNFLFLTWEKGYNQLKIYYNGRLITTINSSSEITDGFYFEDEEVGMIKLKFTNSKPAMMDVSVNGSQYYPEASKVDKEGMKSVSSVFWIITGFALVASFIVQFQYGFNFSHPIAFIELIMDLIIIPIYGISAYFIGKGKGWAYFLGTTMFILVTILSGIGYDLLGWPFIGIFVMLIRVVFIIFILSFIKRAIAAIKAPKDEIDEELLDS